MNVEKAKESDEGIGLPESKHVLPSKTGFTSDGIEGQETLHDYSFDSLGSKFDRIAQKIIRERMGEKSE